MVQYHTIGIVRQEEGARQLSGVQKAQAKEGLKVARLIMVLSSFSPLFFLWAVLGVSLVPDQYLLVFCSLMIAGPNLVLWWRIRTAVNKCDEGEIVVGTAEDHRDHILVYLFSVLLPFYSTEMESWRSVAAMVGALGFVIFLFWHLNLHYTNIFFAALGYRIFTVRPPSSENPFSSARSYVVITKRETLVAGERPVMYRISNTVYFEGVKPG